MAPLWSCRKAFLVLLFASVLPVSCAVLQRPGLPVLKAEGGPACVPLIDRTSYMAVSVNVGTPPQPLELVVDSGSSTVVVVRCGAERDGCYEPYESSTYENEPNKRILSTYGKGNVTSVVKTDTVQVGSAMAPRYGALYVASSFRDIAIDFHGILGLGPDKAQEEAHEYSQLFMAGAGVRSYALCYAPNAQAMWLNAPLSTSPALSSLPGSHWLLSMPGVSAGEVASSLCTGPAPCMAVPDSGTSGIAVPKGHLEDVYSLICDAWPRCVAAAASSNEPKDRAFFSLLYSCQEWGANSLDELPSLSFAVGGSDGGSQTLTLSPWAYVEERVATGEGGAWGGSFAQYDFPGRTHHGPPGSKVCWPSFMEWSPHVSMQGNTWILGTSLFYEYAVHFDISQTPPTMAFDSGSCGACGGSQMNLRASSASGRRPLRRLDRPPRVFGSEIALPPV